MMNNAELGVMAFDVLKNDFHRPLVNGKCNRDNIEEEITKGIYSKQLGPMTQKDVNFICDLIDDMIVMYGK